MSREEAVTISFDLGISALVGENLYNFGELLEHPVISVLQETQYAWLAHLLRAFNAGDIAQYEVLVAAHHQQLEAQPALLQNTNFLKEKITLMCLTETLFQRIGPAADRSVSFNDIAAASKLPCNQVELLLMRALSLQLIRGKIDEVDATCRVEWVLPRVLQKEQIQLMHDQLKTWCGTVDSTLSFMEGETPELAAA
jgi:26S proteasome regulatory subunit N9